jgi:hypothetical protein
MCVSEGVLGEFNGCALLLCAWGDLNTGVYKGRGVSLSVQCKGRGVSLSVQCKGRGVSLQYNVRDEVFPYNTM